MEFLLVQEWNYAHKIREIYEKGLWKATKYSKKMPPIKSCMFSQKAIHKKCFFFFALRSQPVRFLFVSFALLSIVVNCRLPFLVEILQLFVLFLLFCFLWSYVKERNGIFLSDARDGHVLWMKNPNFNEIYQTVHKLTSIVCFRKESTKIVHLDYQMATFCEMSMKFN